MFYCAGGATKSEYRIHLATSSDCTTWIRHPENPMIVDGYEARDPMVLRVGDRWVMYYTATIDPRGGAFVVAAAESHDLVHWTAATPSTETRCRARAAARPSRRSCSCTTTAITSRSVRIGRGWDRGRTARRGGTTVAAYRRTSILVSDDPLHFYARQPRDRRRRARCRDRRRRARRLVDEPLWLGPRWRLPGAALLIWTHVPQRQDSLRGHTPTMCSRSARGDSWLAMVSTLPGRRHDPVVARECRGDEASADRRGGRRIRDLRTGQARRTCGRGPRSNVAFRAGWQMGRGRGHGRDRRARRSPSRRRRRPVAHCCSATMFFAAGGTHNDWDEYDRVMAASVARRCS